MELLMLGLLKSLTQIDERCGELTSTDVREAMFDYVWNNFLNPDGGETDPGDLYLESDEDEQAVWTALKSYVEKANAEAKSHGLSTFKERLVAFQSDVETEEGMTYDEFFGWIDPEEYDDDGNPV